MYCIKCGAGNSDTAVFCRKCGTSMEVEVETRVATRRGARVETLEPIETIEAHVGGTAETDSAEAEIFRISPTLMFVKAGYMLAAFGALLVVAISSAFTAMATWIAILIGMLLFLIPAFYHFKQKIVTYTLTDSKLEIDEGFVSRTTRSVPIRRIQDVTVTSSVLQRVLGFGDLVIDNASEEGGKLVLRNINTPKHYADVLLRQMRRIEC
ncbi:MAG: PH domain-containing protein [Pyrinomonadaceae bacterium]